MPKPRTRAEELAQRMENHPDWNPEEMSWQDYMMAKYARDETPTDEEFDDSDKNLPVRQGKRTTDEGADSESETDSDNPGLINWRRVTDHLMVRIERHARLQLARDAHTHAMQDREFQML